MSSLEGDSLEEGEFREEPEGMGMLLDDGVGSVGGSVERKLCWNGGRIFWV